MRYKKMKNQKWKRYAKQFYLPDSVCERIWYSFFFIWIGIFWNKIRDNSHLLEVKFQFNVRFLAWIESIAFFATKKSAQSRRGSVLIFFTCIMCVYSRRPRLKKCELHLRPPILFEDCIDQEGSNMKK